MSYGSFCFISAWPALSDIIIDASMPAMIRESGQMWTPGNKLKDCKAIHQPLSPALQDDQKTVGLRKIGGRKRGWERGVGLRSVMGTVEMASVPLRIA